MLARPDIIKKIILSGAEAPSTPLFSSSPSYESPYPYLDGLTVPEQRESLRQTKSDIANTMIWGGGGIHRIIEQYPALKRDIRSTLIELSIAERTVGAFEYQREEVRSLIGDPQKLAQFTELLNGYDARWRAFNPDAAKDHSLRSVHLEQMLEEAPGAYRTKRGTLSFPIAALYDVANRSELALYRQSDPTLIAGDPVASAFHTLSLYRWWREALGDHAVKMFERAKTLNVSMDLVLLGDGSGIIGETIAQKLRDSGHSFRVIHIDISHSMLQLQRGRYERIGMEGDNIYSIQSNVIDIGKVLHQKVPELQGAFVVMHELLDDLRAHILYPAEEPLGELNNGLSRHLKKPFALFRNGQSGPRELYGNIPAGSDEVVLAVGQASDPLIARFSEFFPKTSKERNRAFSPESILLVREILRCCPHVAMYIGDYAQQFQIPESYTRQNPARIHGHGVSDGDTTLSGLLTKPATLTSDVAPSDLYFAEAFGGQVEFLGTQADFIGQVNPSLVAQPKEKLGVLLELLKRYEIQDRIAYHKAQLYLDLISPRMFAGMITKGLQ